MAKRRRARENPLKTRDKLLIGGGAATLLGLGIFLLTRSSSASTGGGSTNGGGGGSTNGGGGGGGGGDSPNGGVVANRPNDSRIIASPAPIAVHAPSHLKGGAIKKCPPGFKPNPKSSDDVNLPDCVPIQSLDENGNAV